MADHIIHTARGDLLAAFLKPRLGPSFVDVRDQMTGHPTRRFRNMDSRACAFLCFHHSTGGVDTSIEAIRRHHVSTNGWAGIGYHFVVRYDKVYYVGDVDTERAHVAGRNNEALGVCITGDYRATNPLTESVEVARKLVAALDDFYGRQKTLTVHRDMLPAGHTTCPGDRLAAIVHTLRDKPEPPPYVQFPIEALRSARWYIERLAGARKGDRASVEILVAALRGEMANQDEHDVLLNYALPALNNAILNAEIRK